MVFLGCSTLDSEIFHSCPQVFIKLFSELHIDSYLSIVIFKQNYFLIRKSGCEADELRKKFSSRKKTNIQGTRGNKTMENVMFCSHLVQNFARHLNTERTLRIQRLKFDIYNFASWTISVHKQTCSWIYSSTLGYNLLCLSKCDLTLCHVKAEFPWICVFTSRSEKCSVFSVFWCAF